MSRFRKTLALILHKNILLTIFYDILFLLSAFLLNIVTSSFPVTRMQALLLSVLYLAALVISYSYFKYRIWHAVHDAVLRHSKFLPKKFWLFTVLNVIAILLLAVIFIIASLVAVSVKESVAPFVSLATLFVFSIVTYLMMNLAQIEFMKHHSLKKSIVFGFRSCLDLKTYYGPLLIVIASFLLVYGLSFFFSGRIDQTLFQDIQTVLAFGNTPTKLFVFLSLLIPYLAHVFNRAYLYLLAH